MKSMILSFSILAVFFMGCATTPKSDHQAANSSQANNSKSAKRRPAAETGVPANRVGKYPDPASIGAEYWLGLVPDRGLTPGVIDPCLHAKDLCCKGCTTTGRRHTTQGEKDAAVNDYIKNYPDYNSPNGVLNVDHKNGEPNHEIDHLISLEIGGADVGKNLWPEPAQSYIAGAKDKDEIEDHSKEEMCAILKAKGETAADSYLAMIQRAIAAGFNKENGQIKPPEFSWYHLYFADVLQNTDHHGKFNKGAKIAYSNTLEQNKSVIKTLPAPAEDPSKQGCTAPQIAE